MTPSQIICLRPHHLLLCAMTFVGKGYTPEFTANFEKICGILATGTARVHITDLPDAICVVRKPDEPHYHCRGEGIKARDREALQSLKELFPEMHLDFHSEFILTTGMIEKMRGKFATQATRVACKKCEFRKMCTAIAEQGFVGTHLLRSESVATHA